MFKNLIARFSRKATATAAPVESWGASQNWEDFVSDDDIKSPCAALDYLYCCDFH